MNRISREHGGRWARCPHPRWIKTPGEEPQSEQGIQATKTTGTWETGASTAS